MYEQRWLPNSPVQPGDLLIRRKKSGLGWHYGTGLSGGFVKDNLPGVGKHVTSPDGFAQGEVTTIVRFNRSPFENAEVESRALSNLGDSWLALEDNCEHDANFAQTGISFSPTANSTWLIIGGVAVALILRAFGSEE